MAVIADNIIQQASIPTPKGVRDPLLVTPVEKSSNLDTFVEGFKQESLPLTLWNAVTDGHQDAEFDPNFKPMEHIEDYENYADRFIGANSVSDIDHIKNKIDKELASREVLANGSGWAGVLGAVTGAIADPMILLPAFKAITSGSRAARALTGGLTGVAFLGGAEVIREAGFQLNQETRTIEESTNRILIAGLLGGILGGAAGLISKGARGAAYEDVESIMNGSGPGGSGPMGPENVFYYFNPAKEDLPNPIKRLDNPIKRITGDARGDYIDATEFNVVEDVVDDVIPPVVDATDTTAPRSAGAAQVDESIMLKDEGLAYIGDRLAKILSGPKFLQSPVIRGLTSASKLVRQFTNKAYIHNLIIGKEVKGEARDKIAEHYIRQDESILIQANHQVKQLYSKYTGMGAIKSSFSKLRGDKISYGEFQDRVSRLLIDDSVEDTIAEVNKAAAIYRKQLDDMTKKLQEVDILAKELDPITARRYFPRVWDRHKLLDLPMRNRFIIKVSRWYQTHNTDGTLRKVMLDEETAQESAMQTYKNIMGQSEAALSRGEKGSDVISKGKFTHERSLLMDDKDLAEFLVHDAELVVSNFVRQASPLVHLKQSLRDMGYESLGDLMKAIDDEMERVLAKVTDHKERVKVQEEFKEARELVDKQYRSLTGELGKPTKADGFLNGLMQYQFVRLLGGVTVTSFPELAMGVFRFGFKGAILDGFVPLVKSVAGSKATKAALDAYKDLDIGLELLTDSTIRTITGTDDILVSGTSSIGARIGQKATENFGKISGITYWTYAMRRMAAHMASSDTIRKLKKIQSTGKVSTKMRQELASAGIEKRHYKEILGYIDEYVESTGGSFIDNIKLWPDTEATRAFKTAIQTGAESVALKPGRGDIPFFAQASKLGKVVFQFKSFMSAATGRMLLSGLQRRDIRVLEGLIGLIALGSLSGAVKDIIAGREVETDPVRLLGDGISRSGVLGLIMTMPLDAAMLATDDRYRRFTGGQVQSNFIGPSFGAIEDLTNTMINLTDGKVTDKDIQGAARFLPYSNLFYVQSLMTQMNEDRRSRR